MIILFDPETNTWNQELNPAYAKAEEMMQLLKLQKGENPLDLESGIDYLSIVMRTNTILHDINNVIAKYRQFFKDIRITNIYEDKLKRTLHYEIDITFIQGGQMSKKLIAKDGEVAREPTAMENAELKQAIKKEQNG